MCNKTPKGNIHVYPNIIISILDFEATHYGFVM